MKTLFAVTYPTIEAARESLTKLQQLQKGAAISIVDSVIVSRKADGSVNLDQSVNMTALGAVSGAFWGSLIGLIFLAPLLGAAVGASAGAISGYATDYGIADDFMKTMGARLTGRSSTLFILASDMTLDKVANALRGSGGDIAYTSMPDDVEKNFRGRFGAQEPTSGSAAPDVAANDQATGVLTGTGPQPAL